MLEITPVEGPVWFDHTLLVEIDSKPICVVGLGQTDLMFKHLYIGVDQVQNISSQVVKTLKKTLEEQFAGWILWAFTFHNPKQTKFIKLFGFEETRRNDTCIWYERRL